jgi:hypothetical protein
MGTGALRAGAFCLLLGALAASSVAHGGVVEGGKKLPPGTLRGPIDQLQQYPALALATPAQRAAAVSLWQHTRQATRAWSSPAAARSAGFSLRTARRRSSDKSVHWFHSENRAFLNDHSFLDPARAETLIYANAPGRPLVLIGVMYALARGMHGVTPGGPITRWHRHWVCARGKHRGLAPRPDGTCPTGTKGRYGSEMMHVWFTRDLRSAFAIHAPEPELCAARLLPAAYCLHAGHHHHEHG